MQKQRTLPDIEMDIYALNPGETAELTRGDFTRLFGVNDAARGRLANFARLHNCAAMWNGETLILQKRPPAWAGVPSCGKAN